MANINNPNGFYFVRSLHGQMVTQDFPMAASQTITLGDAVIISSGLIQIGLFDSGLLWGFAAETKITTGSVTRVDDRLSVYPAIPGAIFSGQVSGSSTAGLVGSEADIEGATGVMEVNENATTEGVLQITALLSDLHPSKFVIGANDRVEFQVIRSSYYAVLAAK